MVRLEMIDRPALRYFGGKWNLAPWIISIFPEHISYVEPYCGAVSVLLQKKTSPVETINDIDGEVVNYFEVLREHPDELVRALQLTPYSREEYRKAFEQTNDPIEKARRLYVRSYQGRGGPRNKTAGWRYITNNNCYRTLAESHGDVEHLLAIAKRLQRVQIENDDAVAVIRRYDTPNTLYYVDPPYVHATRNSRWFLDGYKHEMLDDAHIELAKVLHDVSGMVVLSGYRSELYDTLFSDWSRYDITGVRTMGNKKSVESLWCNVAAQSSRRQYELFVPGGAP